MISPIASCHAPPPSSSGWCAACTDSPSPSCWPTRTRGPSRSAPTVRTCSRGSTASASSSARCWPVGPLGPGRSAAAEERRPFAVLGAEHYCESLRLFTPRPRRPRTRGAGPTPDDQRGEGRLSSPLLRGRQRDDAAPRRGGRGAKLGAAGPRHDAAGAAAAGPIPADHRALRRGPGVPQPPPAYHRTPLAGPLIRLTDQPFPWD